ncbi:MAG: acyl-CoA dehydrogenase family protein [Alphaproteobacteria bacterium]|nr:acyl-CoA dehydrogenase family protein [Alphaproteobacteria bacterium]
MDFSFTEEQTLLRNSVARFIEDNYDFDKRRAMIRSPQGRDPATWAQFAELGLLAVPFTEEQGGLGGTPTDTMVILEEFGKGLVIDPYLPTVVLGGGFLRLGGSSSQQAELIPHIVDGSLILAFAYAERQARYDLNDILCTAKKDGSGYVLNGQKGVVIAAPWADRLIVTARTGGGQRDKGGISLFLVDAKAKGVSMRAYPTVDGQRAAEVSLENVSVPADARIGAEGEAFPLIETVVDHALCALSAEAMGLHRRMLELTIEYTRTRKQFDQPLSKFQVLQHRMADMYIHVEETVSTCYMATIKLDAPETERKAAAAAAKVQLGRAGKFIGQNAVQLHGGMGVTEEMSIGHYFKRATAMNAMFGDVDHHLRRFEALTQG